MDNIDGADIVCKTVTVKTSLWKKSVEEVWFQRELTLAKRQLSLAQGNTWWQYWGCFDKMSEDSIILNVFW